MVCESAYRGDLVPARAFLGHDFCCSIVLRSFRALLFGSLFALLWDMFPRITYGCRGVSRQECVPSLFFILAISPKSIMSFNG